MRICHFRAQNDPFALNKKSLVQAINIIFIYLLAPFIVQSFKKILTADPELWGCAIFGPKMAHLPKREFFHTTHCSFHSCLSTCQKSESDINLLMKYWRLENTEILLAEIHLWLQPENQIFPMHAVFAEC